MKLNISQKDVWVADMADQPGGLAEKLAALADAGADLEFIIARRKPDQPGKGVVFITPLTGGKQIRAAGEAGFVKSDSLRSVRVRCSDKAGLGACLTEALADAGINLRGLSAAVVGKKAVTYLAFDTPADAAAAVKVLKKLG